MVYQLDDGAATRLAADAKDHGNPVLQCVGALIVYICNNGMSAFSPLQRPPPKKLSRKAHSKTYQYGGMCACSAFAVRSMCASAA